MNLFYTKSIRGRIIAAIVAVTIPMIVITTLLLTLFTIESFKNLQKSYSISSANFVKTQAMAAMLFDDEERGEKILANFKREINIDAAYILNRDSTLFAKFERSGPLIISEFDDKMPYANFKKGKLYVAAEVSYGDDELLGTLHLIMNTNSINRTIQLFIILMVITLVSMALLTFFFADKSQKIISEPILNLAAFAKSVSVSSSSTRRIAILGNDEIGILYRQFNDMLDKVEARDKEIRTASSLLQDILNSSPSILIVISEDEKIRLHNNRVYNYVDEREIIGSNIWDVMPNLIEYKSVIKSVSSSERDRELRGVAFNLNEISNADITIFHLNKTREGGIVILISDVTAISEKEQQLVQIQKMETVGTLAGGLAHDFNNVMGGIVGTISLLEFQAEEGIEIDELNEDIGILKKSSERATTMVNQLLSLSHKSDIKFENVDLVTSITNVVKILKNSIDKSVEIITNFRKSSAFVLADSGQLEQIFLNISVNAAHSMTFMRGKDNEQGGVLAIGIDEWELSDAEREGIPAGKYQHISISDTGVGIPETVKKKMFDPFFTTKGKGKGTGLGLSMVFNMIKQYDGHIFIDTAVNEGTTFHILFPETAEELLEQEINKLKNTEVLKQSGTILIIDDEDDIRFIARKFLEKCGYSIIDINNGKEGIEFFAVNHSEIDMVLLDMVMPGLSGEEVFTQLKEISAETKVLLSSGFKQDERVQRLIDKGVDAFIHKPYNFLNLSEMVLNLINPMKNE